MKAYHYEGHFGFYLYTTEEQEIPGVSLPANSTEITPPLEECKKEEIPVFKNGCWSIVKDEFWRPKSVEWNYDAGRKQSTYEHVVISSFAGDFPSYHPVPQLINCELVKSAICNKIRLIQGKMENVISLHHEATTSNPILAGPPVDGPIDYMKSFSNKPSITYEYKLESEAMVYLMRRVLDSLVQLSYILTDFDELVESKKIQYSGIGAFSDISTPKLDIEKIIVGDGIEFERDNTKFLKVINHLFNSFKHSLIHDESYNIVGEVLPTIVSYQAKYNDHKKAIIFHNHNIYHLVMGFQDTVKRILSNQRQFIKPKPNQKVNLTA